MRKIKPPEELEGEALLEWDRVTTELTEIDGLKAADRAMVTQWCKVWQINHQCWQHVQKFGAILPAINKSLGRSPWYQTFMETEATLSKLADQLGLTRKARDYDRKPTTSEPAGELSF
jgi:P27 family predicted phage terminase small subunit